MFNPEVTPTKEAPSLVKLGASLVYEALVVIALCLAGASLYVALFGDASHGIKRTFLQLFLWLLIGSYYVVCWRKSGQTLAMQAWRLKLVKEHGNVLSETTLFLRYVLASLSLMCFGLGFLWALLNPNHCYLHDRLLGLRIISIPKVS